MRRAVFYEMQCFKGKPMRHPGRTHPAIQFSLATIILNTNLNILPICILPFILLPCDFRPKCPLNSLVRPLCYRRCLSFIIIFPKKASLPVGQLQTKQDFLMRNLCETYAKLMRKCLKPAWAAAGPTTRFKTHQISAPPTPNLLLLRISFNCSSNFS